MSNIKDFIVPSIPNSIFVEGDYQALEIRVLALASRSENLIEDLNSGKDLHRFFASLIFDKPEAMVTDEERRLAKGFSFQLQYGAGARSIAEQWNVSVELAKKFIAYYYGRYPEIESLQSKWMVSTSTSRFHAGDIVKDSHGMSHSVRRGTVPSIWPHGCGEFHIVERGLPWGGYGFNSPSIKNFPIQGGAADIMLLMLGEFRQWWYRTGFYYWGDIINTVHDSVLFEINEDRLVTMLPELKKFFESVPLVLKNLFDIDSPVEFPTEWKVGKTWGNMTTKLVL